MSGGALIWTLARHEVRLRTRRLSTIVAILAVMAVSWLMIPDVAGGNAVIVVNGARALYDSATLSLGSALLASLMFGLGGFYLVRGRTSEDFRTGIGSVIGATSAGNKALVFGRWLGACAYLAALALAVLATMLVLHAVRGEAPIQVWVYLRTYFLVLLPSILFAASMAMWCESHAPLMGKGGDLLFFVLWMSQTAAVIPFVINQHGAWTPMLLIDFSGNVTTMARLSGLLSIDHLSVGSSRFKAALAPVVIPQALWNAQMIATRLGAALLATLPLLPAMLAFHRFSPDKVKAVRAGKRGSPLDLINGWLRPATALVRPLFSLAARVPGTAGQVLAEIALTLTVNPASIVALAAALIWGAFAPAAGLPAMAVVAVAWWGVLVSDVGTRDQQAGIADMTAAVTGGAQGRYVRQLAASLMLGLAFVPPAALRWLGEAPLRGATLLAGLFALAAASAVLGMLTRGSRTFLAAFLVLMYIIVSAKGVAMLDLVGYSGLATPQLVLYEVALGIVLIGGGYWMQGRRER